MRVYYEPILFRQDQILLSIFPVVFLFVFDTCFCRRQWDNLFYTASESESMDAAYKLNLDTTVYLNFPHDTDIDVKVSI